MLKRSLDVTLAVTLLPVWGVLLVVVVLITWIGMGRPILFRQKRIGYQERVFTIVKFRTMDASRSSSDREGAEGGRKNSIGVWLRKTSLDELPQLVNIIRGEMSFVGPRPLLPE